MLDWLARTFYSETGLSIMATLVALGLTVYLSRRDAYERNQVIITDQSPVATFNDGAGQRHKVTIWLMNRGNRATVVRDIHLIAKDGHRLASLRSAPARTIPSLPFRLDAPDERAFELDLTQEEEPQLASFEVELPDGSHVIRWNYVRLSGTIRGSSSLSGMLTVTLGTGPTNPGHVPSGNAVNPPSVAPTSAVKPVP